MRDQKQNGNSVLIAIAIFKLFKAALLILIGVGALRYMHRDVADGLTKLCHHLRADPHNRFLHAIIEKATGISPKRLEVLSVGTFIYATIFLIEGIGLLMRQRWAEWLTIVSGALLIPFEIYEIVEKPGAKRIVILIVNIAIVIYLIIRVRRSGKQEGDAGARPTI